MHSRMTRSVSSATRTVFFVAVDCTVVCAINRSASSSCEASSKLQVVTQHVDEIMFVGDVRKEHNLRHRQLHISCEGDLDSDFTACAPLMCCVLGGWNAVTIEDYDGGPKVSPQIVTVEGASLWICWEPMRPCYTMEQCPTVQYMLNLASWSGNVWWQTGPDSIRQNGFLWCSRHECVVRKSRWVATQLETE